MAEHRRARGWKGCPASARRLGDADSRAVREAILAHHPALPMTLIVEAVAYVLGSE